VRRTGDPLITYSNVQAGFYLQDDVRIRRNLTITPGVRYEAQTHLDDYNNIMPRVGITWAPFKSGKTTLRASYGFFYDWISPATYEQTLRVDGFKQQEINISDPDYPIPGVIGTTPATNRYLYSDTVLMAKTKRLSAGQPAARAHLQRQGHLRGVSWDERARGHNLNQPVAGVRLIRSSATSSSDLGRQPVGPVAQCEPQLEPGGAVAAAPAAAVQLAPPVDLRQLRHQPLAEQLGRPIRGCCEQRRGKRMGSLG
jgi:hypothetical protein